MNRVFSVKRQTHDELVQEFFIFALQDKKPVFEGYTENRRDSKRHKWETQRHFHVDNNTIDRAPLPVDIIAEAEKKARKIREKEIKFELFFVKRDRVINLLFWFGPPLVMVGLMGRALGESNPWGFFGLWFILQFCGYLYHLLIKVADESHKELNEKIDFLKCELEDLNNEK